ncbi:MAG: Kae1-associated serine/threonine protein kinase [Candidatus Iainarchaeum archaeon]|uniref:non-specific serine/threonine protein kinase n=1 Tax=Candidatus Iainarchaeum sp. TaxID=3101447 RepID=A0A7T9DK86_9ARCH|nr:MAG: Kae1-associated serine/threonine protein kinase [Candidatus Diapherotrites archaeon]
MRAATTILSRGAEATIEQLTIFGKECIKKTRIKKSYRHPSLDEKLRKERMSHEAKMLHAVKELGVRAPLLYAIDHHEMAIYMEYLDAPRLKHVLQSKTKGKLREELCVELGKQIATLHAHDIVHGDLTTSNVLVDKLKTKKPELVFIDFGLASITSKLEDKAVDLVNLKKTFSATHSELPRGWELIVQGYLSNSGKEAVLKQLKEVEARIRYA